MSLLEDDDDALETLLSFVHYFQLGGDTSSDTQSGTASSNAVEDEQKPAVSTSAAANGAFTASSSNFPITTAQIKAEETLRRRRAADNARKKRLRKAGVYKNPNKARDGRRLEIAYLRENVTQLETELEQVQHQEHNKIVVHNGNMMMDGTTIAAANGVVKKQVSAVWKGVASRQRLRRDDSERENVRLKMLLESQIKVAKSLESLLFKRAVQQASDTSVAAPQSVWPRHTIDFRADAADFKELLEIVDAAYRDVDKVLRSTGLNGVELAEQDIHVREDVEGMYLEVFSNKAMPFGLRATGDAAWNYFKGSQKHRGKWYAKASQSLDAAYTIIEHFSKELVAGSVVHIKQVVRRYVEADREVVIWVAWVAPIKGSKPHGGSSFYHRHYIVIKRATASTSEQELSLLQSIGHLTVNIKEGTIYDPKYVRQLTDILLSNTVEHVKADQEFIESLLVDQTLHQ